MRIVVIGAPGSGKSTITDHLTDVHPCTPTFGVRRYFAEQVNAGTPLGRQAEQYVRASSWIPDPVVVSAIRVEVEAHRLGPDFILEGMPGNIGQAELLDKLLSELDLPLHAAVHVRTPRDICLRRATTRLVCERCDQGSHQAVHNAERRCVKCGTPVVRRATDDPERFVERLDLQEKLVDELASYYRGPKLVEVDGTLPLRSMVDQCAEGLARVLAVRS